MGPSLVISYIISCTHLAWLLVLLLLVPSDSFGSENEATTRDDSENMISSARWTNLKKDRYTSHHGHNQVHTFPAISPVAELSMPMDGPETLFSRFDVGNLIVTAAGIRRGIIISALMMFPVLFPVMVSLGIALFVIALFATSGTTFTAGSAATVGRKLYVEGNPPPLLNLVKEPDFISWAKNGQGSGDGDQCVQKIVCLLWESVVKNQTVETELKRALKKILPGNLDIHSIFKQWTKHGSCNSDVTCSWKHFFLKQTMGLFKP